MSDIDPEKLARAIHAGHLSTQGAVGVRTTVTVYHEDLETLRAAAIALLPTLPRFKEVEVWRVEYAVNRDVSGSAPDWCPDVEQFGTERLALARFDSMQGYEIYRCVGITGPHKQRVPA